MERWRSQKEKKKDEEEKPNRSVAIGMETFLSENEMKWNVRSEK